MCSKSIRSNKTNNRKYCKKKDIIVEIPSSATPWTASQLEIEFDLVIIDELWTYINKKYVSEKGRKSATGTTVWTIVAIKDNRRYVKAIVKKGPASDIQFQEIIKELPKAKEYHSDSASWYKSALISIYNFYRNKQYSRANSYKLTPNYWFFTKSFYTNIVEGIHNLFRNKIASLKRKSSCVSRSLSLLQIKLNYASLQAWRWFT